MTGSLDSWASEQRKAIATRGMNVLVSAGAGSGKTTVLVERVVSIICSDDKEALNLDRLLIVTFTEAAAAEMRERIAKRLVELRYEAETEGNTVLIDRINRQQNLVDEAQISTLHSFCLDIVRRNFFELGLEPSFSILSPEEGALVRSEILQELLERRLQRENAEDFSRMLQQFQVTSPERLQKLVFRVDEFARSQPSPKAWLESVVESFETAKAGVLYDISFVAPFLDWASRKFENAQALCDQALDLSRNQEELTKYEENLQRVQVHIEAVLRRLDESSTLSTLTPELESLSSLLTAKGVRGKAHPLKDTVRDLRKAVKDELEEVMAVLGRGEGALLQDMVQLAPQIRCFIDFVQDFQEAAWTRKQALGQVDFNDLEHLALRAIHGPREEKSRKETGERLRLRTRFAQIFVDEYQDTSPIQDALVNSIQSSEGNLFVVGDVKQSIYRFRMAEPQLFLTKRNQLREGAAGIAIDLAANYRSRKSIVDMVNLVFTHLFSEKFGGIVYDDTASMKFGNTYPVESDEKEEVRSLSLAGPIEVHLIERSGQQDRELAEETTVPGAENSELLDNTDARQDFDEGPVEIASEDLTAMEQEAIVMVERIKDFMGLSGKTKRKVYDTKQKAYRDIKFQDIVILLRSAKGRINVILDVFQKAGIPAYGATSSGFFAALEVQWLISTLAAVDNPRRDIDFAALLRSPLGGFTDEELGWIRLCSRGSFYDATVAAAKGSTAAQTSPEIDEGSSVDVPGNVKLPGPVRDKCVRFLKRLRGWRRRARQDKAYAVLRQIIEDTGLLYYLLGMPGGTARRANVEALLDKAREFDTHSFDGVFGFVHQMRETIRHDLDLGEARTLGEHEDVVRVMTIHQSKGLEFPVVFIADLGKTFYQNPEERMFPLNRQYGFGPQFIDFNVGRRWKTLPSLAVEEVNLAGFLEEEARVLYVAMTRARERLILVGSHRGLPRLLNKAAQTSALGHQPFRRQTLMNGKSYLDWILPICLRHPQRDTLVHMMDGDVIQLPAPLFTDTPLHITVWNTPTGNSLPLKWMQVQPQAIGLPPFRPTEGTVKELRQWLKDISNEETFTGLNGRSVLTTEDVSSSQSRSELTQTGYPSVPGKVTATDLRRLWAHKFLDSNNGPTLGSAENLLDNPVISREGEEETEVSQRERGIAFHAVMQHLDLNTTPDETALVAALDVLVQQDLVSTEMRQAVAVDDVLNFLVSPLGHRLAAAKRVFREQGFFHRIPVPKARMTKGARYPFVVVQGVIDCLAEEEGRWLLIDYKTDRVSEKRVEIQAQEYAAQVATYLHVAREVCGEAPVEAYLYFVNAQQAVRMDTVDLNLIFDT